MKTKQIAQPTRKTLEDARASISGYINALIQGKCSFYLRHDPIEHFFNLTSKNSADAMHVLIPNSTVRMDGHGNRYSEVIINYV